MDVPIADDTRLGNISAEMTTYLDATYLRLYNDTVNKTTLSYVREKLLKMALK
jgi:hypothetical protein